MSKFQGQQVYIDYSVNGGTTWKLLMSTTKKDWKNATDSLDATSDTSPNNFKEMLPSRMTPTLSVEGFSEFAATSSGNGSYLELQSMQLAQTKFLIRVVDDNTTPVNRTIHGEVFVKELSESYETSKLVTFKVDFEFTFGFSV